MSNMSNMIDLTQLSPAVQGQMEYLEVEPYGRTPAGHVRVKITYGDQGTVLEIRSKEHPLRDDDIPRFCELLARRVARHMDGSALGLHEAVERVNAEVKAMLQGGAQS